MARHLARYVLKTLWRHRRRTLLTAAGACVAMFVFGFVGAAGQGLDRLGSRADGQRTLIVFQANRFCPATSRLPEDYAGMIARVAGVEHVVPIQVYTNNCRASLDVVVFHGLPPEKLRQFRRLRLISGQWSQFELRRNAALVGRRVAARRGLEPGKQFTLGRLSVTVAGVFSAEETAEENLIYTHLDFLQRTGGLGAVGQVTQFEVRLAPEADPAAAALSIDAALRNGPVGTDTRAKSAFEAATLADLAEWIAMLHWVGYACVGLVLAMVATTTVMTVQDRVGEHAVLQVVGFSAQQIFAMVLAESVLLASAGGTLGVLAAQAVLAQAHLALGSEAITIAVEPSLRVSVMGLGLSAVVGLLAGLLPAWHAARADIVPALRPL